MAQVKVHKAKEYTFQQSKFEHVPELPFRTLLLAPSGGGKTTLIVSSILDIWKGCFERIYIVSPTVHLDDHWNAVKEYCKKDLKYEPADMDECFQEEFHESTFQKVIDKQFKITKMAKDRGMKQLYSILLVLDDIADNPQATKSRALGNIFVRGRHAGISVIASLQKVRTVPQLVRVNASDWWVFRLRNQKEAESIVEENSGAYGVEATWQILKAAHVKPHDFLWINGRAKDKREMFWLNFEVMLVPRKVPGKQGGPGA